jgi:poly(rC)-binding protein 2/3/4
MPASQCGSLIGKGGSKIKEIREITGASVVVASEMLPNSTERAVTVSGTSDAITQCIYHICCVMLESPPKGATIPYRPKPQVGGPVILAGGQAYTIQGNYAVPATPDVSKLAGNPLANLAALGLGGLTGTGGASSMNASALAALAGSQLRSGGGATSGAPQQTQEMSVPNELIGCIIGKGGTKIAEIRQISGAMIRISNCEDRESSTERTITITGSAESVALAQYLINTRLAMETAAMGMMGYPFLAPSPILKATIH